MNSKLQGRILRWSFLAGLALAAALPLAAEPGVRITGAVSPAWNLPPDLRAELVPLFPGRAAAEHRLAGEKMEPLAVARPDAAGRFELLAPAPGFYRVIVRAQGWGPRRFDLTPLLEPFALPPVPPNAGHRTTVARLKGPDGRPLAGVEVDLSLDGEERLLPWLWQDHTGSATTDAEGRIELPAHQAQRALRLHRPNLLGTVLAVADAGPTVVPQRRIRWLEVRTPGGDPVPSALVSWRSGPVGLTGADGRIAVSLPAAGEPPLFVEGRAGLSAEVPAKGAAADPLVVRLRPPVTVSGRVVDASSGRPISDAWVWAEPLPFPSPERTGPAGRFALTVPPGWRGRLHAAAAGTLREEGTMLALRDAGPAPASLVEIRLRPAAVATGQVVDADGKGVAGAMVRVITPSDSAVSYPPQFWGPDAYSDADGGFRLPGLLPDAVHELSVRHADFVPQRATLRTSSPGRPTPSLRIVLDRGQAVTGRVIGEDGQPMPGAELSLTALDPRSGDRIHLFTRSEKDGGFVLRPVLPGPFLLQVSREGWPPLSLEDLVVPAGSATVDLGVLRLERGAGLEGRVVDASGNPVAGAEVRCYWQTGARRPDGSIGFARPATTSFFTGTDGGFRFDGLSQGGLYGLWVHYPLHTDAHVENLELPLSEPVQVHLTSARTLSGRVTSRDGEPVADAVLHYQRGALGQWSEGTDADGRFRIAKLTPGVIDLKVGSTTHRSRLLTGIRIPAATDPAPLEIVLDKGEALEGRVTDSRGEPVPGAWVQVDLSWEQSQELPEELRSVQPVTTGRDGWFFLGGLEVGAYKIEAGRQPWQTTVQTTVEVHPGTNRIDLSLGPESEVSGRVRTADGAPVPGARVDLEPEDPRDRSFSAVSAADGSFRIPFVSSGRFRLQARRKGFAAASPPVEMEVAGEAVPNLEIRLTRTDQAIAGRLLGLERADLALVQIGASSPSQPGAFSAGSLDGEGGYRISDLGPGEWNLFAYTATGRRAHGVVRLAPGVPQTSFDLDFAAGLSLSGRVLVDRQPLAGAWVHARSNQGEGAAMTQGDGSFRITGLLPATYKLEIRTTWQTVRHSQPVTLEADREVLVEIESGSVSGQVTSAAGEPLNGASVELSQDGGGYFIQGPSTRTGTNGRFTLPQVSPGSYQVVVKKDGFEAEETAVTVQAGGTSVLSVALTPLP